MITLATLSQATAQEVFDQCAKHLLTQKRRSTKDGTCTYRSPDGLKCAAGCFISDDEYRENMETNTWANLFFEDRVPVAHFDLIRDLQHVHDCHAPSDWWGELSKVAWRHRLSPSVLEELKS